MKRFLASSIAVPVLFTLACSAEPSSTGGDAALDSSSDSTADGRPPYGAVCWENEWNGTSNYSCALPTPCAAVTYQDGGQFASSAGTVQPSTINLEAARCVLQALRDDVRAEMKVSAPNMMGGKSEHFWSLGDGTVVVERRASYDSPLYFYRARRFEHRDGAWFDTCLALTDAQKVYECLTSWWTSCFEEESVPCPVQ